MKKKLLAALLTLTMLLPSAFAVDLYVDGSALQTDVPPTILSGRTLVPLRAIFEALDAEVGWDGAAQTATATKSGTTVQVTIDDTTAYVNGQAQTLDVPAKLIDGRTMVPARFVSEALDARVLWDGNTESVYVITSDHQALVVEYLDVGQADSILLSSDGEYMLIDAGNNVDGDDIISYLREVGADELKYVVGTHPHADHIGGMDDAILELDVDQVLLPRATTTTQTYADVLDAIETKNVPVTVPTAGQTFQLGDATVSVVAAQQADDLNNVSIVLRAAYEDTSFLFMGDAETEVETAILSTGTNIQSNVLKVGHHGSSTSTGSAFLAAVAPDAAVISCGAGNSYGHPSAATLQKLTGIPVWRTDLNGTIIAMTDGQTCRLTADKGTAALKPPATSTPGTPSTPSTPTKPSTPSQPSTPNTSVDAGGQDEGIPSTVYITPTGKRYHYKASCAGKNATPTSLSNAKSRGLTPCQKCAS